MLKGNASVILIISISQFTVVHHAYYIYAYVMLSKYGCSTFKVLQILHDTQIWVLWYYNIPSICTHTRNPVIGKHGRWNGVRGGVFWLGIYWHPICSPEPEPNFLLTCLAGVYVSRGVPTVCTLLTNMKHGGDKPEWKPPGVRCT